MWYETFLSQEKHFSSLDFDFSSQAPKGGVKINGKSRDRNIANISDVIYVLYYGYIWIVTFRMYCRVFIFSV